MMGRIGRSFVLDRDGGKWFINAGEKNCKKCFPSHCDSSCAQKYNVVWGDEKDRVDFELMLDYSIFKTTNTILFYQEVD